MATASGLISTPYSESLMIQISNDRTQLSLYQPCFLFGPCVELTQSEHLSQHSRRCRRYSRIRTLPPLVQLRFYQQQQGWTILHPMFVYHWSCLNQTMLGTNHDPRHRYPPTVPQGISQCVFTLESNDATWSIIRPVAMPTAIDSRRFFPSIQGRVLPLRQQAYPLQ